MSSVNHKVVVTPHERAIKTESRMRRMKSRRLQGVHRLTSCHDVQVDIFDNRQDMTELQS